MRRTPGFHVVTCPSTSSMKMAYSLTPSTNRRKRSSLSRRISWVGLDDSPKSDGCIGTIALPPGPRGGIVAQGHADTQYRESVLMSILVGYKHSLTKISSIFAALGSLGWLVLCFQWFRGTRKVPVLEDLRSQGRPDREPALSVILAARHEERSVKGGVTSLLAQDYPGTLEV